MKALLRSAFVQGMLATILVAYLWFALGTMRWRFEGRDDVDLAVAEPEGIIGCFWHGRIAYAIQCRRMVGARPRRVLISLSRDGEFIARALNMLGWPAIRGSAGRKAKGGAAAFREALAFLREGGVVAITPDGPRGPTQSLPQGPLVLARTAQTPVFLFGLAGHPAIGFNSWDRARVPLPFSKGAIIFDGPHRVPEDADDAALEALRADWETRLTAAQDRAEALVR